MTAAEILRDNRITTKSTAIGRYYTICPRCSYKRKKSHQKLKCLGVTIDAEGVQWGCNHCTWKGGEFYENARTDRPRGIRAQQHIAGNRRPLRDLYR